MDLELDALDLLPNTFRYKSFDGVTLEDFVLKDAEQLSELVFNFILQRQNYISEEAYK